MERINIRIATKTHRRLNLIKGQMGVLDLNDSAPTLDDVINAGLDLLEKNKMAATIHHPTLAGEMVAQP